MGKSSCVSVYCGGRLQTEVDGDGIMPFQGGRVLGGMSAQEGASLIR